MKSWPYPCPETREEEDTWYNNEIDRLIEELNGATQNIMLLQCDKSVLYEATQNLVGVLKLFNGTIKELESSSSLSVQQEIGKVSEQRKCLIEENQVVIELANLDLLE
jgi:hypothetical protein